MRIRKNRRPTASSFSNPQNLCPLSAKSVQSAPLGFQSVRTDQKSTSSLQNLASDKLSCSALSKIHGSLPMHEDHAGKSTNKLDLLLDSANFDDEITGKRGVKRKCGWEKDSKNEAAEEIRSIKEGAKKSRPKAAGKRGLHPAGLLVKASSGDSKGQKSSLVCVLQEMVLEAGAQGISAREAGAKLLERGLLGLITDETLPRSLQIARAMKQNPGLMRTGNGKFVLWNELTVHESDSSTESDTPNSELKFPVPNRRKERASDKIFESETEPSSNLKEKSSGKKDLEENRCKRMDGKGWQCYRLAQSGYSLCDYHLDKFRENHLRQKAKRKNGKGEGCASASQGKKHVKARSLMSIK